MIAPVHFSLSERERDAGKVCAVAHQKQGRIYGESVIALAQRERW